jgi:hypothetical protein
VLIIQGSRAKKVMDLLERIAIEHGFMISTQDISKLSKGESDIIFNASYKILLEILYDNKIPNRSTDINCNTLANKF